MLNYKLLIIIQIILETLSKNNEIFINYGVDADGIELFKFFYDVNDGYYAYIEALTQSMLLIPSISR